MTLGFNGQVKMTKEIWDSLYPNTLAELMQVSEEAAREWNILPNGYAAPEGFWKASKKERDLFLTMYNPSWSDEEAELAWSIINSVVSNGGRAASPPGKGNDTSGAKNGLDPVAAEKEWCKKNLKICFATYEITQEVWDYVHDRIKKEGGLRNAVRHFIWQVILTLFIGEKKAAEIGEVHEKSHWPADGCGGRGRHGRCDVVRDPHNNAVGRKYAIRHKEELLAVSVPVNGMYTFYAQLLFDTAVRLYKKRVLW